MRMTVERYDKILSEWVLRDTTIKQITPQKYEMMFSQVVKEYIENQYSGTETIVESDKIKQTISTTADGEYREIRTFYK